MSEGEGIVVIFTGKGKGKTSRSARDCFEISWTWSTGSDDTVHQGRMVLRGAELGSKRLEPEFDMVVSGRGFVGIIDDDLPLEEHQAAAKLSYRYRKEESQFWRLRCSDLR